MTNDDFGIHLISSNSLHRNQREPGGPKDRRRLLKYAIFYLVVAAILIVSNQISKDPMAAADQSLSSSNLRIDLSVAPKIEPNMAGQAAGRGTYNVHFRLTNQGNQPIFYPVSPDTNRPLGQIVYRITPGADWRPLSAPELSSSAATQLNVNAQVAWIEMPPGGWVDGEYEDPGAPVGDHAYQLDLKVAHDAIVRSLLSRPYPVNVY